MDEMRLSRRRLLTGMAALAASPSLKLGRANADLGRPNASNRIVMACIGVGGMGSGNMNAFLDQSDVQVVAVCDVDKNHQKSAKASVDAKYGNSDCKMYGDFREMLARTDIDAISMATPDHWHAIPAITAARAGMDVYGEKPLSHTLLEGRAMVNAVKQYGRIWQTGSWQRSVTDFRRACELVRNGRIGKVSRVEVGLPTGSACGPVKFTDAPPELDYDFWVGPSPWTPYAPEQRVHYQWRWQLNYGGGQLMDWIGHHGDIAHWGMGWDETGPLSVEGSATYPEEGIWDAAITYHFTAMYPGGVEMHVANGGNPKIGIGGGTKWHGENGQWVHVDRGMLDANPKSLLQEKVGPNEIQLYQSNNHHRNFLDCIKTRKPTITPSETAHRSASIGHLGQIAMMLGRKIQWNPATETILNDESATRMLGTAQRAPWHL